MPSTTPPNLADAGTEVATHFVRGRNALVARAEFGELFVDYYLHLGANMMKPAPEHDALFKRALVAFVLHTASRPRNELTAWTINFQEPRVNLFLTGDNETGTVTGRIFDENVKALPENIFYSDVVRGRGEKRRSAVTFAGADPVAAAEKFYEQSEQRLARFFQVGEEEYAMVTEHPDCDLAWLRALTDEGAKTLATRNRWLSGETFFRFAVALAMAGAGARPAKGAMSLSTVESNWPYGASQLAACMSHVSRLGNGKKTGVPTVNGTGSSTR